MSFVKLDCGILDSTLWVDRDAREVFITALLMAVPGELPSATPQIEVDSLKETGWMVPPGWYGLVPAAGVGIIRRAGIDEDRGIPALKRLGAPEADSRSHEFDGRRLVRVDGGYVVLNFVRYRERDHSAAERSRRYRERKKERESRVAPITSRVTGRSVTQADAEVEAEAEAERSKTPSTTLVALKRDDIVAELHSLAQNQKVNGASRDAKAKLVFAYWAAKWDHPQAVFDPRRHNRLAARLKENGDDASELLYVIDGSKRDDWDGRAKFSGIEQLFKDRGAVEKFAPMAPGFKQGVPHPLAVKYGLAPEVTHAVG